MNTQKTQSNNNVSQRNSIADPLKIYALQVELENYFNDMSIWRTLEIPENYSFFGLHVAIQDAMNWLDIELHKFNMINPRTKQMEYIGILDDLMCEAIVMEKNAIISDYFTLSNCKCSYLYNFVKPWEFCLTLNKILPAIPRIKYIEIFYEILMNKICMLFSKVSTLYSWEWNDTRTWHGIFE